MEGGGVAEKRPPATLEASLRVACQVLSAGVLVSGIAIMLFIRQVESITGDPKAYENADHYKSAAWRSMFVAVVGIIVHPVMTRLCNLYISSFINDHVAFGMVYAGCNILIALVLLVEGMANALYAQENRRLLKRIAVICDDSIAPTTDDDRNLCYTLRNIRNAEVAAAIFSFTGMLAFSSVATIVIRSGWQNGSKQVSTIQKLLITFYHVLTSPVRQVKRIC